MSLWIHRDDQAAATTAAEPAADGRGSGMQGDSKRAVNTDASVCGTSPEGAEELLPSHRLHWHAQPSLPQSSQGFGGSTDGDADSTNLVPQQLHQPALQLLLHQVRRSHGGSESARPPATVASAASATATPEAEAAAPAAALAAHWQPQVEQLR